MHLPGVYRGQAEKEFRVEVEAIGHVRHKNLVRLLGYCVEGVNRYVNCQTSITCSIISFSRIHSSVQQANIRSVVKKKIVLKLV